ncbi:hypothetical protein L6452_38892 [Arctium lappa]|uniref:Uncharacterized protein n=1 Tax=Arctium lappa TaxID=4217 RepID=A0ACB8XR99_ARCLA|nr:hypothetical protein L6452_38892 [Arctium lappa]
MLSLLIHKDYALLSASRERETHIKTTYISSTSFYICLISAKIYLISYLRRKNLLWGLFFIQFLEFIRLGISRLGRSSQV